jgi:serine phosphatase RsbU (regulator of sigma subunit)
MLRSKSAARGQFWFKAALAFGCVVGLLLLAQSIAGYFYVSRRLVRDQLQREADRQAIRIERSLRSLGTPDIAAVKSALDDHLEEQQQRVAWLRIIDARSVVLAQAGPVVGKPPTAEQIRRSFEERRDIRRMEDTADGRVFVAVVPIRAPIPGPPPQPNASEQPLQGRGRGPRLLEVGLREEVASGSYARLRVNLLVSSAAALMLVGSMLLLARRLRGYLRGQQLEQQFAVARRVQHDLLPGNLAPLADLECAGTCIPAWQVGGDFYDVFRTPGGKVAMLLGDVSGKGLGAALVMSLLHGAIRCSDWLDRISHERATGRLNRVLYESTAREMFATLFWAYYDEPLLHYVNAGHVPPLLVRANGEIERLTEGGMVLGVIGESEYRQGVVHLEEGDLLVLCSDGVLEAADAADEEFGEARLQSLLTGRAKVACRDLCDEVVDGVRAFARNGSLDDDLTILLVRVRRREKREEKLAEIAETVQGGGGYR